MKKTVTIYDIAKESGVSTATVSRVMAGNYPVSKKTREKVLDTIEKFDFQPNAVARSLSSNKSKVIGFITPEITNPFFSKVFIEFEKFAHEKGYSVLLCNSLHSRDLESKYIQMLLEQRAEGIVLLGGLINDIDPDTEKVEELKHTLTKTKLVMINGKINDVNCYSVRTDEGKGIELIIDHLVKQGHTDIGLIGGQKEITTTDIKLRAFKKALKNHNLSYNSSWQIYSGYDITDGEKCVNKLISNTDKYPSAILCMNDMVAIGATKEFRRLGVENIQTVGFDNTDFARTTSPELTTVGHPYELLAKTALEVMLHEGNYSNTKNIILDPILVKRESTLQS